MANPFDDVDGMLAAKKRANEEARDSDTWDPEPGEKIVGVLLKAEIVKTRNGPAPVLVIRNLGEPSGGIASDKSGTVWASRTVLWGELEREMPAIGKRVAIQFDGKKEPTQGGNAYFSYTVIAEESDHDLWDGLVAQMDRKPRHQQSGEKIDYF